MVKPANKRRFFSLHRKGLIALSFLLLLSSAAFGTLNYWHLKKQFEAQQAATYASLHAEFKELIERSADRLQRLGVVLASLGKLSRLIEENKKNAHADTLMRLFANVRYELDVERIELFDHAGVSVWNWPPNSVPAISAQRLQESLRRVYATEQPYAILTCQPLCELHAFVPLLADGRSVGIVAINQMIADLVLDFSAGTGTNIAILVPPTRTAEPILSPWPMRVAALSNAQQLIPFLRHLAQRYPTPSTIASDTWFSWQGSDYTVQTSPLGAIIEGEAGQILFLTDVTTATSALRRARQDLVLLMGISTVCTEVILLMLLRNPLHRLKRLAGALPLLAHGGYRQACQQLSLRGRSRALSDEIDLLYETSLELADQLEENQSALAAEKDFIQGLLDSAQVLILTQTRDGRIHAVNHLVSQLVGRGSDDLRDVRFIDLIQAVEGDAEGLSRLEKLLSDPLHRLEHEAALTCQDGSTRHIVWVHTRLGREHHNGVAILSVGLDATDRVQAESRIRWLANHDPLTGLANRLRFKEELERSFAEASRNGVSTALLLFDLDHFKDVNDTSGHAAGDALLCHLANELRARARKSDILARLGGDEFAVLMTGATREGAEGLADALNERLTARLFHFGDRSHRISASIGIALIPEHGNDVEEVMANADAAMYQAKKNGRGQWHLYSPSEEARAKVGNRAHWRSVIAQSLAEKRLFFHYQPIIQVPTGRIAYHEALLRVRLEDGRVALPGEYMEIIVRSDLMHAIDCFVAQEALRVLADNEGLRLSINLSAAALNDPSWVRPLKDAVRSGVLVPSRLLFEITETAAIADLDTAKELMDELSGLGFGFALDDFGTGFASYHYLKQLPIKHVKIDRSFVSKLASDEGDRVFVTALTTLAHGYRQQVVAEGVEDAATLAVLRDLGVDMAQGFFIGHPDDSPGVEQELLIARSGRPAACNQLS